LWGSSLGLIAIILLWAMCSLSIVLYLRTKGGQSAWNSLLAPAIAFLLLSGVFILVLANVTILTGATPMVNRLLLSALVLAFGTGIVRGLHMRHRRPDLYAKFASGNRS
jgi:hypothetical protein